MTMAALAEEMTADYMRNLGRWGSTRSITSPRHAKHRRDHPLTQTLVDKGFAYDSEGDVYFDVANDPEYGKLSNRDRIACTAKGATWRTQTAAADFALWKSAKPGEPSWRQPLGQGRPGWHIECSAMSRQAAGQDLRHSRRRAGPGLPAP